MTARIGTIQKTTIEMAMEISVADVASTPVPSAIPLEIMEIDRFGATSLQISKIPSLFHVLILFRWGWAGTLFPADAELYRGFFENACPI
jgi:hypothetical protein